MIDLRTLGAVDLRDGAGAELRAVLVQPRQLALLTYLAVSAPRLHRRDSLLALFWPEQDVAHARLALRQALHRLRSALGDRALLSRGDEEVGLDEAQCRCDVQRFEQAMDAGELEGAAELYRGAFLDGFFLSDAPEFERWVEGQRGRLDRRYAEALEQLAQSALERGDAVAGARWYSRLAEHSPHPSRIAMQLMRALDAAGDRAGAIRHADQHAARLRADLDAAPDPEVEALAARLRAGPVARGPRPAASNAAGSDLPRDMSPVPKRLSVARVMAAGAGLVLLGLVAWGTRRHGAMNLSTSDIRPVTIEPGVEFQPALSPDGNEVAFIASRGWQQWLVVRSLISVTGGSGFRVADGGSLWLPRWSPDGEFVRFLVCPHGSLPWDAACNWKEIGRLGGPVRPLAVPGRAWTAAWSADGARMAFSSHDSLFSRLSAGGEAVLLSVHTDRPTGLHSLVWSPDGRRLAYVVGNQQWLATGNLSASSIWIVGVAGGEPIRLTPDDILNVSPAWLDDHHLLFISDRDGPRGVYVVEVDGKGAGGKSRSVLSASDVHGIAYSPGSRRLVYAKLSLRQNIWSYPLGRPSPVSITKGRHVTDGNQIVEEHDVSPDGRWIVFDSYRGGDANIYKVALDGGAPVQLDSLRGDDLGPRWSPDGTEIVFYGAHRELFAVPAEGGIPSRLTSGSGSGVNPRWSPDGLRLAFNAGGLGPRELRFMMRDRVGGPWRESAPLTKARCQLQAWASDGSGVLCTDDRDDLTLVSPSGAVVWRRGLVAGNHLRQEGSWSGFSRDGATVYLTATHQDGRSGIWAIPMAGGAARLVIADDQPSLSFLGALSVGPDRLYATVSEYECDIWATRLRW